MHCSVMHGVNLSSLSRRVDKALVAVAGTLLLAACGSPARYVASPRFEQQAQPQPRVSQQRLETSVHALINRERAAQGLKPITRDDALDAIARGHSADMGKRDYFEHESPEGEGFGARYRKARYSCALRVGNVIYKGAENMKTRTKTE